MKVFFNETREGEVMSDTDTTSGSNGSREHVAELIRQVLERQLLFGAMGYRGVLEGELLDAIPVLKQTKFEGVMSMAFELLKQTDSVLCDTHLGRVYFKLEQTVERELPSEALVRWLISHMMPVRGQCRYEVQNALCALLRLKRSDAAFQNMVVQVLGALVEDGSIRVKDEPFYVLGTPPK